MKKQKQLLSRTEACALITRTKLEDRPRCSFCGDNKPSILCEAPKCPLLRSVQLNGV